MTPARRKILCVTESQLLRDRLSSLFRQDSGSSFQIQSISPAMATSAFLSSREMQGILLDFDGSDPHGYELLERFRAVAPDAAVICLVQEKGLSALSEFSPPPADEIFVMDDVGAPFLLPTLSHAIERKEIKGHLAAVTQELSVVNRRLEKLGMVDPLTDTLNRRGLQQALAREIEFLKRDDTGLLVLMVNLDNFKQINDAMGHAAGDVILQEISSRLRETLRVCDYVARIAGDEFAVLLPQTRFAEGMWVAEKVRLAIGQSPVSVNSGEAVRVTASLGLLNVSRETPSLDQLLAKNRLLLKSSKLEGKNKVAYESHEVKDMSSPTLEDVRATLQREDRFLALKQPIFDLREKKSIGYEFLSRSMVSGFETPDHFFRVSMEANILTLVDYHCFKTCVRAGADLADEICRHLNIFPSTLMDTPTESLIETMAIAGRRRYCLEISEQQIIGEPSYLKTPVEALRRAGVQIAIDDVGFGRSCLESLILLEPDLVKIDKKCVSGIRNDELRRRSLKRLMKVTESLGCQMVAEGIESFEDLEVLRDLDVQFGQGYLFGRPE
ncbi:MAG: diguanylate cyclase [Candidatus Omnitrophica bacterium]|nr:diguanylate cyclase [Candidatus Omnitrophota bacterium]